MTWLVVGIPTPLKNDGVRQIGSSSELLGKIKNVPNHQPVKKLRTYWGSIESKTQPLAVDLILVDGTIHNNMFRYIQQKQSTLNQNI